MPSGSAAANDSPPAGKWNYGGKLGPVFWGDIDPAWTLCKTGTSQSPIDIPSSVEAGTKTKGKAKRKGKAKAKAKRKAKDKDKDKTKTKAEAVMGKLAIDYLPIPLRIRNTGLTVQIENIGNNYISIGKKRYELLGFHFHSPSEHTIAGKRYDLEMHLVHKAADEMLAVVTVLFEKGKANDALKGVWKKMPKKVADEAMDVGGKPVDLAPFTVLTQGYYQYSGSLTTPPCSEGVTYFVLAQIHEIAEKQVKQFRDLTNGRTNRLIQPLGERNVMMLKP